MTAIIFRVREGKAALPLVSAYHVFEQTWIRPMPFLLHDASAPKIWPLTRSYSSPRRRPPGSPPPANRWSGVPTIFGGIFVTDVIRSGLPPHIAAKVSGRSTVDTMRHTLRSIPRT